MTKTCPCCDQPVPGLELTESGTLLRYNGKEVRLSPREGRLFRTLLDRVGRDVPQSVIFRETRQKPSPGWARARGNLAVHIFSLRQKVIPIGLRISTAYRFGYRLEVPNG